MKAATLYRMVTPDHICPFGVKSKYLLERQGYQIEDHHLKTRQETDAFKAKHNVKTTPQTFIDGQRIGGYDDLRAFFHKSPLKKNDETTYLPVLALFGGALLMTLAIQWISFVTMEWISILQMFAGLSMCLLAIQKLKDLESFSNGFLNYDLASQKWIPYSYIYPFVEMGVGLSMLSGVAAGGAGVLTILVGLEGAASVFKAVYIDKRELKCACMGGDTKVPLGFISLTENLMMIVMGAWMAL